ncbi:MAG: hypothetical protein ACI8W8_002998 [Rhodothermales bacterium]|jgi:hypothetical protein
MSMDDDIPLKPKEEGVAAPKDWSLEPKIPHPNKVPPSQPKSAPVEDEVDEEGEEEEEEEDGPLFDEAGSLLDELKTILGDRRCKERLAPRILKLLYPLMMLGFAPFSCIVFEMAILKYSGLIAAVMTLPVAITLLFIQFFVFRVGFEMAYTVLADRK